MDGGEYAERGEAGRVFVESGVRVRAGDVFARCSETGYTIHVRARNCDQDLTSEIHPLRLFSEIRTEREKRKIPNDFSLQQKDDF